MFQKLVADFIDTLYTICCRENADMEYMNALVNELSDQVRISQLISKLRFPANCSFFLQSFSFGHHHSEHQPPKMSYQQKSCPTKLLQKSLSSLYNKISFQSRLLIKIAHGRTAVRQKDLSSPKSHGT